METTATVTIRLAGSTNLGRAQMAAIENLVTEIRGKRYTVTVPRIITASVSKAAFAGPGA